MVGAHNRLVVRALILVAKQSISIMIRHNRDDSRVRCVMIQRDRHKVIAVVPAAAEPALIDKWCEDGELPVMSALRRRGTWTRLDSPSYISSGCSWPTLNIGTNPAKHGVGFFHREIQNGTYNIIKKYADKVHGESF